MLRGDKRWLTAGLLVVMAGAAIFALRPAGKRDAAPRAEADGPGLRPRDYPSAPPDPPEVVARRVAAWRRLVPALSVEAEKRLGRAEAVAFLARL